MSWEGVYRTKPNQFKYSKTWNEMQELLKQYLFDKGYRLILSVPDEDIQRTIPVGEEPIDTYEGPDLIGERNGRWYFIEIQGTDIEGIRTVIQRVKYFVPMDKIGIFAVAIQQDFAQSKKGKTLQKEAREENVGLLVVDITKGKVKEIIPPPGDAQVYEPIGPPAGKTADQRAPKRRLVAYILGILLCFFAVLTILSLIMDSEPLIVIILATITIIDFILAVWVSRPR